MHRFLIIIEQAGDNNFSAYSPDLPGCVATGATREDTERRMYEAIELHIEGLIEDKQPVPQSISFAEYVVGFEPAKLDDKLHKLEVKIKQPGAKGTYRRRSTV